MAAPVLHQGVIEAMGREIVAGDLRPGAVLTLAGLTERFGVSRTVGREAMRVLEQLGLVTSGRRVGIVVQDASAWNVFDRRVIGWRLDGPGRMAQLQSLTELRIAVEPLAAALAAVHATTAQRTRLTTLAALMRETGEAGRLEEFLGYDIEFHAEVLAASGNEMFTALSGVVAEVLSWRTHRGLMPHSPREVALAAHEEVARGIASGNARTAEDGLRTIVDEVRAALIDGELLTAQ